MCAFRCRPENPARTEALPCLIFTDNRLNLLGTWNVQLGSGSLVGCFGIPAFNTSLQDFHSASSNIDKSSWFFANLSHYKFSAIRSLFICLFPCGWKKVVDWTAFCKFRRRSPQQFNMEEISWMTLSSGLVISDANLIEYFSKCGESVARKGACDMSWRRSKIIWVCKKSAQEFWENLKKVLWYQHLKTINSIYRILASKKN